MLDAVKSNTDQECVMELPPLDQSSREILRDARENLAEEGIELTFMQLEEICQLGMMLSMAVKRPIAVELWDGQGLQFDAADQWIDFLEFWDEESESIVLETDDR